MGVRSVSKIDLANRVNEGGVRQWRQANSKNKPESRKPRKPFDFRGVYLVRLAGIEPTTPWFVAKYSIQLSYSREASYSSRVLKQSFSPCLKSILVGRDRLELSTKGL